ASRSAMNMSSRPSPSPSSASRPARRKRTAPPPPIRLRRRAIDPLAAGAAAFAAAELALGLLVGGALGGSRAEALVFLAFRPWLIFAAALLIASWEWRRRLRFYLLALTASGLAEALFLWALGGHPWTEMLRGLA